MIDRIAQLYAVEAEAKRASLEERLATLAALRAEQSKPLLDEIRTWMMTQRALPRSGLGKAIATDGGTERHTGRLWSRQADLYGPTRVAREAREASGGGVSEGGDRC